MGELMNKVLSTWTGIGACLALGFFMLAMGANWLVDGSSFIARRVGVSTLAIGLTVVAWGTSAPEVVVSANAALAGRTSISLGNVLGSNMANIGLVMGCSGLVLPSVLQKSLNFRDLFWFFGSLALLWGVSADHQITRTEASMLLGSFAAYTFHVWWTGRSTGMGAESHEDFGTKSIRHPWLLTLLGFTVILIGAEASIRGAVAGSLRLGMSERVVGLTIVAVGTSLPEFAAGLGGAFKGESDISIGNVVGSNVFNVLAVLGIIGLIHPLVPDGENSELADAFANAVPADFLWVLGFSLAAVCLPLLRLGKLTRFKGLVLVGAYAYYIARLV